jgi:D-alanyl-D-alanine dipeptidase
MDYLSSDMIGKFIVMLFVFTTLFIFSLKSQSEGKNQLKVISTIDTLKMKITTNPSLEMVELKQLVPGIKYDLAYARKSNFTKHRLYPKRLKSTYLRKEPAVALSNIAKELKEKGIGILVWDAYRPYSVTERFWNLIHDERYVANPVNGSGHNRGIAIDMTLYELNTGKLLEMPTGFDDFSEKAHQGNQQLSEIKINNREFLRIIMEKHGFVKFETEWWHYSWPSPSKYDVLNIPFWQLK